MRIVRDIFAAIMIGLMGGFLVTILCYYNSHKEQGAFHTMMAVANSVGVVSDAYSHENTKTLSDMDIEKTVLEAFDEMDDSDKSSLYSAVLNSILGSDQNGSEGDVLAMEEDSLTDNPYSGIIRFHVRANSDSQEDQELKMAVKEDVVTMLKPVLARCSTVEESRNIIVSSLQNIYVTAVNTIVEQGYDYEVKVYLTEEEFPAKTYGDLTFPAGKYQALRIDIGEAKGHNWWCVMYPPLCFIDESTAVVSKDGKELLKKNLTDEEYRKLFANPDVEIEPSCKLYEWIQGIKKGD